MSTNPDSPAEPDAAGPPGPAVRAHHWGRHHRLPRPGTAVAAATAGHDAHRLRLRDNKGLGEQHFLHILHLVFADVRRVDLVAKAVACTMRLTTLHLMDALHWEHRQQA